jgi:hypothetical protein
MTETAKDSKVQCVGTGQPAIQNPDPDKWPYPTCPVCLRDFSVSGKRGHPRAWESTPRHFVTATTVPAEFFDQLLAEDEKPAKPLTSPPVAAPVAAETIPLLDLEAS